MNVLFLPVLQKRERDDAKSEREGGWTKTVDVHRGRTEGPLFYLYFLKGEEAQKLPKRAANICTDLLLTAFAQVNPLPTV